MPQKILEYAGIFDRATQNRNAISQFPDGAFDVAEAYQIQNETIAIRCRRGESRSGLKMGFTSQAKMRQMGLDELIYGQLTDGMLFADGAELSLDQFIHPRVEPELAILLKRPLHGSLSPAEVSDAIEAIAPALEIIDSRYQDFKFSLPGVIADNASARGYVLGPWSKPDQPFENLGIVLSFDGRPRQFGTTAAALGQPLRSLCHAARLAAAAAQPLAAGFVILTGGATTAEPLARGLHVQAEFQNIGGVGFSVAG
jgi:2-oxo-3-hexenedioate decarboxylase